MTNFDCLTHRVQQNQRNDTHTFENYTLASVTHIPLMCQLVVRQYPLGKDYRQM